MRNNRHIKWFLLCSLSMLEACSTATSHIKDNDSVQNKPSAKSHIQAIALRDRLAWPAIESIAPVNTTEKLYTFSAKDLSLEQTLKLFSNAFKLNLVIDQDITGTINVDFQNLPFDQAMSALLDSHGYYWIREANLIHIRSIETRSFTIDYIRLIRSGSGSSQAQLSSGSSDGQSSGGEGGGQGSTGGAITIEQTDKVDFWDELETQLKILISEKGRLTINRLSGTIQVTDQHRRVEEVRQYIEQLNRAIYRQVDIEVKIVEVTLNDDYSLGIDWTRLVSENQTGRNRDFIINHIIGQPAGGGVALPAALDYRYSNIRSDGANRFTGVLNALQEQGEVKIVSQPHIRTLNNQSALIKVGTDRTFFRKEQLTDTTTAGSQILSTDVPQVVTEGIVLAITPQISVEGWITMNISPVVTRVSSVSEVKDENGVILSTAPNLDISQASSLVRTKSGETIIIGGLIQTQNTDTMRGIPWLYRIPGLGHLFKGNYKSKKQRELIMFVTPRLIKETEITLNRMEQP